MLITNADDHRVDSDADMQLREVTEGIISTAMDSRPQMPHLNWVYITEPITSG